MSKRVNKEVARQRVMRGGPSLSPLLLPGEECVDVLRGIELGVFTAKSVGMLVERDPKKFRLMSECVRANWPGRTLPAMYKGEMCDTTPVRTDLAFLDYQGNLRSQDVVWLRDKLAPAMTPAARFHLTFTNRTRGNTFFNVLHGEFNSKYKNVLAASKQSMEEAEVPGSFTTVVTLYQLILQLVVFPKLDYQMEVFHYCDEGGFDMMLLSIDKFTARKRPVAGILSEVARDIERVVIET